MGRRLVVSILGIAMIALQGPDQAVARQQFTTLLFCLPSAGCGFAMFYSEQVSVVAAYGELHVWSDGNWGFGGDDSGCYGCMRIIDESGPHPQPVDEGGGEQQLPYLVIAGDHQGWSATEERHWRLIYYQGWNHDATPYLAGGTVTEGWVLYQNPCNYSMVTGIGSFDQYGQFPDTYWTAKNQPVECSAWGLQEIFLPAHGTNRIHAGEWQFTQTGVVRIW